MQYGNQAGGFWLVALFIKQKPIQRADVLATCCVPATTAACSPDISAREGKGLWLLEFCQGRSSALPGWSPSSVSYSLLHAM